MKLHVTKTKKKNNNKYQKIKIKNTHKNAAFGCCSWLHHIQNRDSQIPRCLHDQSDATDRDRKIERQEKRAREKRIKHDVLLNLMTINARDTLGTETTRKL